MSRGKDLTGEVFGNLEVIELLNPDSSGPSKFKCKCKKCDGVIVFFRHNLKKTIKCKKCTTVDIIKKEVLKSRKCKTKDVVKKAKTNNVKHVKFKYTIDRIQLVCNTCQKPFLVIPSRRNAKFCSKECQSISYINPNKKNRSKQSKNPCELCNCTFQYTINEVSKKNPPILCIRCKKVEFKTLCTKCNREFIRKKRC